MEGRGEAREGKHRGERDESTPTTGLESGWGWNFNLTLFLSSAHEEENHGGTLGRLI
jgi:hypothetical protein